MAASLVHPPRDLIGYADTPPQVRWPGNARVAVNFVINYEEGGERSLAYGDLTAENRLADVVAPVPLAGARDLTMESAYEYGSRVGLWRILRLFRERGVPFTVYAVGLALKNNPRAAEAFLAAGCDFVDHGWRWFDYAKVDEATEREHMEMSLDLFRRLTGEHPAGWYIGTPSAATRPMRIEEGGFLYDSDAYNDDMPYWTYDWGRPHLIVPHTLDTNDTRFARGLGWNQAQDFTAFAIDEFEALRAEGATHPRMMTIAVHLRLAGKPARAAHFARLLDHIIARPDVWVCRRVELARHWIAHHPPESRA